MDALPRVRDGAAYHPLRLISELGPDELALVLRGFSEALESVLSEGIKDLRRAFAAVDTKSMDADGEGQCKATKFALPPQVAAASYGAAAHLLRAATLATPCFA